MDVTIRDLGTLPGYSDFSVAKDVNEAGQIVGTSYGDGGNIEHGFLWQNGTMTDLGTLGGDNSFAYSINDVGQVVGSSSNATGVTHAFLWQNGTMIDLGGLHEPGLSAAWDVNNAGSIVGWATALPNDYEHAAMWWNGGITDLGTLGGYYSEARSVSATGQIVGWSWNETSWSHPFLWENGTMTDLGTLPGDIEAEAWDISDAGQVVGVSHSVLLTNHAFVWENGTMTALEGLGGSVTGAYGINDAGQIVGASTNPAETSRPVLWESGTILDLGSLSGGNSHAFAINEAGQIVGNSVASDGQFHAVLWTLASPAVHDVAVTSGSASPLSTTVDTPVSIAATVLNAGTQPETFDMHAYAGLTLIGTQTVTGVNAGESANLSFLWNTTGTVAGSYSIELVVAAVSGETNLSNNVYAAGTVVLHDRLTAQASATPSTAEIGSEINFTCAALGGWQPYTFAWDFGDSSNDSGENVSHAYASLGGKTATCVVTDDLGAQVIVSVSVQILDGTLPNLVLLGDIVAEPTGPSGAIVEYTVTAHDDVDGDIQPSCDPPSGSTFPIATTTVACTATDSSGNTASASFMVTVRDTIAPALTTPGEMVEEATGATGAVVTYAVQATDLVDAVPQIDCNPPSGLTFPLGVTIVECTAVDSAGNVARESFSVLVRDTGSPVLTAAGDIVEEATGPNGAVVNFEIGAADIVDPSPTVGCLPASGSTFPLGTTAVTCTATDEAGNQASIVFTAVVRDTTRPTLQLPPEIVRQAANSSGAIVTFQAIAEDAVDPSPVVTCEPAAGSRFPVGDTQVTCSAQDSSGNVATGSFLVTIRAPEAVSPAGVVGPWILVFLLIAASAIVGLRIALRGRKKRGP